jgi:hypothetical protein
MQMHNVGANGSGNIYNLPNSKQIGQINKNKFLSYVVIWPQKKKIPVNFCKNAKFFFVLCQTMCLQSVQFMGQRPNENLAKK